MTVAKILTGLVSITMASGAAPSLAQDTVSYELVAASDPGSVVRALAIAGYDAKLDTDEEGDPMIRVDLADFSSRVLFYGCDEADHTNCDSIQFSTGFDREQPWDAKSALQVSSDYRFVSVSLDDEGDPYITWDIMTGEGIPLSVFLKSVRSFEGGIRKTAQLAFADQRQQGEVSTDEEVDALDEG